MVVTLIENVFKRLIYGSLIEVEVKLCKFYNRFIKKATLNVEWCKVVI